MSEIIRYYEKKNDRDVIRKARPCERCMFYNGRGYICCKQYCNYTHDRFRKNPYYELEKEQLKNE